MQETSYEATRDDRFDIGREAEKSLKCADIAKEVGRPAAWVTAALLGQEAMTTNESKKVVDFLGLYPDVAVCLQEMPTRGALDDEVPKEPTLYRFYEMLQLYHLSHMRTVDKPFARRATFRRPMGAKEALKHCRKEAVEVCRKRRGE